MLTKLMLALVLSSASAAMAASVPPEIADCKVFKVWQFTRSAEGWRPDHNVSPFAVKDGLLSFTNTGPDPWIINAGIGGADTSKYGFLGIKMRSSVGGSNQVYFATDKSTLGEGTVISRPVRGDGQFHFYEIDLSQLKTWTGKLSVLRIDPVNGGSEVGAKIAIDWIALYQTPARLTFGRPELHQDNLTATVTLPIRNVGGEPSGPAVTVTAVGERAEPPQAAQALAPLAPGESRNLTLALKKNLGDVLISVKDKGRLLFDARLVGPRIDDYAGIESSQISINWDPQYAAISPVPNGAGQAMCILRPYATLAYKGASGAVHYIEVAAKPWKQVGKQVTVLRGSTHVEGGQADFTLAFDLSESRPQVAVTCAMGCTASLSVLRFEGPRLLAAGPIRHAIFPGLWCLERNEAYTAKQFIGPKLADQHIPHPYKIAVPLMAVEATGHSGEAQGVIGLSWDPLQEWAPGHALPCAEFEPDKGEMTLFAPSIPDYVDENQDFAKTPYTLKPGQKMTLKMSFFTEAGKKIEDVIPDYLKSHPLKPKVDSKMVEKTVDTCFKAYAGSLYSKEAKGWKSHFGLHQSYTFNPGYAANVLAESLRKADPDLARKVGIDPNAQLAQYSGTTLDWFTPGASAGADAAIARQSADGGFPYTITEDMTKRIQEFKQASGVDTTTLGTVGETNSGLIARELGAILDCAVRTGEKKYVDAGLKGLDKLNSYTVPRGAQTWEVHAHTPDVYAAALAINCNIAGYHLTGDPKYLDHATFWARTGLPFVYTWVPPISPIPAAVLHFDENGEGKQPILGKPSEFYTDTKRHINPGATIAVFGSSFYFVNWFGTPVQWCGLAWADSVQALMKLRRDPVLQSAADSVFASGAQQQFDKGFAAGTYPDSWTLATDTVNTAFIAPDSILTYAYGWLGEPRGVSSAGVAFDGGRAYLNSFARIESLSASDWVLQARLKYYPDQDVYVSLAHLNSHSLTVKAVPALTVKVDGLPLPRVDDLQSAPFGWLYDPDHNAMHIKYRTKGRIANLEVSYVTF